MGGLSLSAGREALGRVEPWLGLAPPGGGRERGALAEGGGGGHGDARAYGCVAASRTRAPLCTRCLFVHCFLTGLVQLDVNTVIVIITG
jgi:hypothetical protein